MSETVMKYDERKYMYRSIIDILRNYTVTPEELLNAMRVYAEWQENVGLASLEDTLWMEDSTPMTPDLTRYLYHQLYEMGDVGYCADSEDDEYDE